MPAHQNPHDPRVAARTLQQLIRVRDLGGIARARKFILELQGKPDPDVPDIMVLMKCQHVIAKELGFVNWDALRATEYTVRRLEWNGDFDVLFKKSLDLPQGSAVRRLVRQLEEYEVSPTATGTKEECQQVLDWIDEVFPEAQRKTFPGNKIVGMSKTCDEDDDDWDSGESENMLVSYNEDMGGDD